MRGREPVPTGEAMKEQRAGNIARLVARRREEDARASPGNRIARTVTRIAGSMSFIALHTLLYGGALVALTVLMADPLPLAEGLGTIGSVGSIEAMFLALFVLANQRREEQRAEARADFTLHVSLLTEDELTKLASVVHRMAEKLGVPLDAEIVGEVEKNVDPEQVLDAIEETAEGETGTHDAATGADTVSATNASNAS